MHERAHCPDEAANHQLPIAAAFWIIWIVSAEECLSVTQNLMQICCSTRSVILNVMATQYTCSFNGIYHPHWLVQGSRHCPLMHIPVHSPWLPGYNHVMQTILVTLKMAGLFLDRPHIHWEKALNCQATLTRKNSINFTHHPCSKMIPHSHRWFSESPFTGGYNWLCIGLRTPGGQGRDLLRLYSEGLAKQQLLHVLFISP